MECADIENDRNHYLNKRFLCGAVSIGLRQHLTLREILLIERRGLYHNVITNLF